MGLMFDGTKCIPLVHFDMTYMKATYNTHTYLLIPDSTARKQIAKVDQESAIDVLNRIRMISKSQRKKIRQGRHH